MIASVIAVSVSSCVGPARDEAGYRGKAASTADHARSAVETTLISAEAHRRHGLPGPYLAVVVGEAEEDAAAASAVLASIQPPDRAADAVRERTLDEVDEDVDLLAHLRIEVRRGHLEALARAVPRLRRAADRLERLATDLRSGS